ncbi:MAG: PAS domain-containing sensor histidine kinase, partial [Pseudomonadota bacterium]|nr:PAS domain-containing sensor histidine kinase [Pseudomonadota bacterium]
RGDRAHVDWGLKLFFGLMVAGLVIAIGMHYSLLTSRLARSRNKCKDARIRAERLAMAGSEIVIVHREFEILDINAAGLVFAGLPNTEAALDKSVLEFTAPRDRAYFAEQVRMVERGEKAESVIEIEVENKRGSILPVTVCIRPAPLTDPPAVMTTLRDISHERELVVRFEEAHKASLYAEHAKSAFITTLGHEIRSPVNTVIGMVEVLSRTRLNDDQRELLVAISRSGAALVSMIDEALDYAKVESGDIDLMPAPARISDIVENVASTYAPLVLKPGADFQIYIAPELDRQVLVDRHRLHQALGNLIGHALRATKRGHIRIMAEPLKTDARQVTVLIRIQDKWRTLPVNIRKKFFAPFSVEDPSASSGGETLGLGLAISRRLIESMRGQIGVESLTDSGTTLWVRMPLPFAPDANIPEVPDLSQIRVLVACSDTGLADILRRYLTTGKAVPTIVHSSAELVETVHGKKSFDVLVCDGDLNSETAQIVLGRLAGDDMLEVMPTILLCRPADALSPRTNDIFVLDKPV